MMCPEVTKRLDHPAKEPGWMKKLCMLKETFRKPSQIYLFLRENWKRNPIYLTRTLAYVSKHRAQTVRRRETKIDVIATILKKKQTNPDLLNNGNNNNKNCRQRDTSTDCDTNYECSDDNANPSSNEKVVCFFNWICNDPEQTSQITRTLGFGCPWCNKDYKFLDTLMAHLKCCHSRFNFNIVEEDGRSVIAMSLNSSFDGSYCGFRYPGHNLRRDFRFRPTNPIRRTPLSQIIHFKPRRNLFFGSPRKPATKMIPFENGDSYGYDDDEADIDVCSGRLYYHTSTCLPVKPNEVDIDSEADIDPDWLRERTQLMIDEFTDVNEGEKEILKAWNVHIMKNYKYKGDHMIRQACIDFVESEGPNILSKNLTKNFLLHLSNLYDFGLIGSGDILECSRMLKKLRSPVLNNGTLKTGKIKLERNSNEHCQPSPAKRALLNSHCNQ